VTRADGGPFILYEFDAAGLYVPSAAGLPTAQQVTLVGLRVGGGIVSASYGLSDLGAFAHFSVPGTWSDLQAVTFAGLLSASTPGALALDDVGAKAPRPWPNLGRWCSSPSPRSELAAWPWWAAVAAPSDPGSPSARPSPHRGS